MLTQLLHAFNFRSETGTVFSLESLKNKWLVLGLVGSMMLQLLVVYLPGAERIFQTVPLPAEDWVAIVLTAIAAIAVMDVTKLLIARFGPAARAREGGLTVATERPTPTREQLAVCAHDLRGSLTVIAGYVELLRRDDLTDDDRAAALAGIDAAIGRADALLADTLAGTVRTQPDVEPVHLAAVAERAAADARAATGRDVVFSATATRS